MEKVASGVTNIGDAISEQQRRMNCEQWVDDGPGLLLNFTQRQHLYKSAHKSSTGCRLSISFSVKRIFPVRGSQELEGGFSTIQAFRAGNLVQEEHFGVVGSVRSV
jgi:hypothetical protein